MSREDKEGGGVPNLKDDLVALTKARLSFLVLVTTFVGYWLCSRSEGFSGWLMFHTLLGSGFAALGSAVFNQLMEIDADARMGRTADRPLPAKRMPVAAAFIIGGLLCAFGLVHLAEKVNSEAAALTALTLFLYIFVYTPLKQRSTTNTLVGAVAGAIPPVIGWAAGFGPGESFRAETFLSLPALFLFLLLFFWQLPHFVAINWMYRDQYRDGGFVMWSNDDDDGSLTSTLALGFAIPLIPLMALPVASGHTPGWFAFAAAIPGLWMVWLAIRFFRIRTRPAARKLFLYTLLYLPVVLVVMMVAWRENIS